MPFLFYSIVAALIIPRFILIYVKTNLKINGFHLLHSSMFYKGFNLSQALPQ